LNPLKPTLSLSTGSLYHWPVGAVLQMAARVGFDAAEFVIGPEALVVGPVGVRAASRRAGLPLRSIHPPIVPLPGWIRLRQTTAQLVRWAADLAVDVLTLHAPSLTTLESERGRRYVEAVDVLARDLAAVGARLAIENRARFSVSEPPACLDQPADLLAFAKAHGVWVTMDATHAGTMTWDLNEAYAVLAPVLANVHLSDLRRPPGRFGFHWLDTVWRHHLVPGAGCLPLDRFVALLGQTGYQGLLTLELSPLAISGWSVTGARRNVESSLRFVKQHLAGPTAASS
jgi:sugar phosphate isomerase/epimerase